MEKPDCKFFGRSLESDEVLKAYPDIIGRCDDKKANITSGVCNQCDVNKNKKKGIRIIQNTVF